MSDDIIKIKEVAEYLKIKEKTAYALAAKGEIPGFKVSGSWRFRRSEIEMWIKPPQRLVRIMTIVSVRLGMNIKTPTIYAIY